MTRATLRHKAVVAVAPSAPGSALTAALAAALCSAGVAAAATAVARHRRATVELADQALEGEVDAIRDQLAAAGDRERRHDLANAMTAVEGAAMILGREVDSLTSADRQQLGVVLETGLRRLRQLALEPAPSDRLALATAVARAAGTARAARAIGGGGEGGGGVPAASDVPPGLEAVASAGVVDAVLRLLFDHLGRPGGPALRVRGEGDGEWAKLIIEEPGPRRRPRRPRGPRPGRNRAPAHGVRLAARLLEGQEGDLSTQPRADGGATWTVRLPAAPPDSDPTP